MNKYLSKNKKILSIFIFVIIWEILALGINNYILFPDILNIIIALGNIISQNNFLEIIAVTFFRIIICGIFSLILGSFILYLEKKYKFFTIFFYPWISILRIVPTVVVITLIIIWSNIAYTPYIIGILVTLPLIYDNLKSIIENINKDILFMAKIFQLKKIQIIKDIIVPNIFFQLTPILPSYVGLLFKGIVAGEMLALLDNSIGGEIALNKVYIQNDMILGWVFIIVIISVFLEKTINLFITKINFWRKE